MKVLLTAFVVLGVGLGPGLYAARRRRRGDEGGRLWLGRVVAVVATLAWLAALVLIIKAVW